MCADKDGLYHSTQYTPECRNEQKENRLKNWKDEAMNLRHLRQPEENAAKMGGERKFEKRN